MFIMRKYHRNINNFSSSFISKYIWTNESSHFEYFVKIKTTDAQKKETSGDYNSLIRCRILREKIIFFPENIEISADICLKMI